MLRPYALRRPVLVEAMQRQHLTGQASVSDPTA